MTAQNTEDLLEDHLGKEVEVGQAKADSVAVPSQQVGQGSGRVALTEAVNTGQNQSPERVLSSLRVGKEERQFMKQLAGILDHSPRRTLRFVNSYRVIKASFATAEVEALHNGGYRALLVLLALATCAGEAGSRLIFEVSRDATPLLGADPELLDDDEKRVKQARELIGSVDVTTDELKKYAPIVARFSFERHWSEARQMGRQRSETS